MNRIFKKTMALLVTLLMLVTMVPFAYAEECSHDLLLDGDIKTPVTCKTCNETLYSSDTRWAVGDYEQGLATGNIAVFTGFMSWERDQIIAYFVAETVDGNPYVLSFDWAINQGYTQYGKFKMSLYHNDAEMITHDFSQTVNPYKNIISDVYEYTAEGTLQVFKFVLEKSSVGTWADSGRTAYLDNIINACKHTGGNATCTQKPICEICNEEYGDYKHNWSNCDGICAENCGAVCTHDSFTGIVCDNCGYECTHERYTDGRCDLCDSACAHESYTDYKCAVCGMDCAHESLTGLVCDACGYVCTHENYTDGICSLCKYACPHESYSDYKCAECGMDCPHESYTDYICDVCGASCPHENYTDGVCDDCGILCIHEDYFLGVCVDCGFECEHPEDSLTWSETLAPTCVPGKNEAICEVCGLSSEPVLTDSSEYPESEHNYAPNTDYKWYYSVPNASKLILHFSKKTELEDSFDDIYLYDANGAKVAEYTGTELSGKIVEIDGNAFSIRLRTDGSSQRYGFSFDAIEAVAIVPELIEVLPAIADYPHDWSDQNGICSRLCGTVCDHSAEKILSLTKEATCVPGEEWYNCSVCGYGRLTTGDINDYPESTHNYEDDLDYTWHYSVENAQKLVLYFSQETKVENHWDDIYIYNASGSLIGSYTGTELAGEVIEIEGNSFSIRLDTDGSTNYYGFSFDLIEAYLDAPEFVVGLPAIEGYPHDWSNKDGVCVRGCGKVCEHDNYSEGKCTVCGYACLHDTYTEGICDICNFECPHESYTKGYCNECNYPCFHSFTVFTETVAPKCEESGWKESYCDFGCGIKLEQEIPAIDHEWGTELLERPTQNPDGTWNDGYYYSVCVNDSEHIKMGAVAKRGDYDRFNELLDKARAYYEDDTITDEAKEEIAKVIDLPVFGYMPQNLLEAELNTYISLLDNVVTKTEAGIEDGTALKADYTEIDETVSGIDEALEEVTISDEMKKELADIKAQLEALKGNAATTEADLENSGLLDRAEAIAATMNNCANGIHSFTSYTEVSAPECGKAGTLRAICDHGCGAVDEQEIPALTHSFVEYIYNEDADCEHDGTKTAICENGCGTEDVITAEGTKLGHVDEDKDEYCENCGEKIRCSFCGEIHSNLIEDIICLIMEFFHLIKQAFRL
ncbi:MAG: hypothetical protein IJO68_00235 [Clostridia bacterium]|nr:hypothetical protein [Clostridia bacterium]